MGREPGKGKQENKGKTDLYIPCITAKETVSGFSASSPQITLFTTPEIAFLPFSQFKSFHIFQGPVRTFL